MEMFLKAEFDELEGYDDNNLCFGYVEPGHGWKGKQVWLNTNDDLRELYSLCGKLKNLLIWCYLPAKNDNKRSRYG